MTGAAERISWAATAACTLEASSEKPGNVTPTRRFLDMTHADFLLSGLAVGPVLGRARRHGVGQLVRLTVEATRAVTRVNTNLGILLLMAPLARAYALYRPTDLVGLRQGVAAVLTQLSVDDARSAYVGIRQVQPGGLGKVDQHDVAAEPTITLREAMAAAADRDMVAAQYATDYELIFQIGAPALLTALDRSGDALAATVQLFLTLLAAAPDSLIARKLGRDEAERVTARAGRVLDLGGLETDEGRGALAELDRDLRDERNRRNPGTTADLTAATLFAVLLMRGPSGLARP